MVVEMLLASRSAVKDFSSPSLWLEEDLDVDADEACEKHMKGLKLRMVAKWLCRA